MSTAYGTEFQINRKSGATYFGLGGTPYEPTLDPDATVVTEVGCGEGTRAISAQKTVAINPKLSWTMNVRNLSDYILAMAMITGEGVVPSHDLAVRIGTEYHLFTGCKVNTCKVTIRQKETIKAALEVLAKGRSAGASWTFIKSTDAAMWKDSLTTLSIGGTPVTNWSEAEMGIDNKVQQESLGVDIMPTEMGEREAMYTGYILRAISGATLVPDVISGATKTMVYALRDNATTPVTKTFTFANATLKTSRVNVRGLEMVMERIEWQAKTMVVT
jgi:hypothetical protein